MSEFDTMADAIYEALPLEGESYQAAAEGAAAKLIADGWMSRAAAGDAQAREAELIAEPLRRRVRGLEADLKNAREAGKVFRRRAREAEAEIERLSEQIAQLHIDLDFERDVSLDMESRFSSLLCELTDGRMSKTNYDVRAMVQEVEAASEREVDEATADLTQELESTYKQLASLEQQRDAKADELDALEDRLSNLAGEWAATGRMLLLHPKPHRERGVTYLALANALQRLVSGTGEAGAAA